MPHSITLPYFEEIIYDVIPKTAEPELLAQIIYKALTIKKPKPPYSVKSKPWRSFLEWLPMTWTDVIFKKVLSCIGPNASIKKAPVGA